MRFADVLLTALTQLRTNKLRSFFTLLGIIVSVGFLVAVIAIIQGMNAYVKENIADAMLGANAFQVRRTPTQFQLYEDDEWARIQRRPRVSPRDGDVVKAAVPNATAVAMLSGWPTPQSDVQWRTQTVGDVITFGITAPYQVVQDYKFAEGQPISDIDVMQRRYVVVLGADVAKKLFEGVDAIGKDVKVRGQRFTVTGVVAPKGNVLGQSMDGFILIPISTFEAMFGRRQTTTVSVKMPDAQSVATGMRQAEEAMRVAHHLRPGTPDDFSIETSDALVDFWKKLTSVLFTVVPAMVAIGIVVGGIVIMNIMLMSVRERTHEIGLRKSVGATRRDILKQFLAESIALATVGGAIGAGGGWLLALLISLASPLPARVTTWSVLLALALGAGVGVLFGVYPASRAARLDPVTAMRAE